MSRTRALALPLVVLLTAVVTAACGSSSVSSQAQTRPPLAVDNLTDVQVTGDPSVSLHRNGGAPDLRLQIDDSGLLVVDLGVVSGAATDVTLTVVATMFDAQGKQLSQCTGDSLAVKASKPTVIHLTGPSPGGTIARVVATVTTKPTPTAVP